jgi:hypothetical protein
MATPTPRPDLTLTCGDDWAVLGTRLDIDGSPLDLTDASLKWVLVGPSFVLRLEA